ncbi:MAG: bifunctional folylpolyglutamate synthase/dihydrofolate synthase [Actinomycetota bacterium]|nr:bifunctional folylpolyglutamate synthase/dihydrofolate synthase [Actinomycetota bacterium]
MTVLSYEQALDDLESRVPTRMVPDLSRITALTHRLGEPQRTYPSVHVTGTNGKTSVSRMIAALFEALGIQAGTYTSPHLQSLRERIRVGNEMMTRQQFAAVYQDVAPLAELVDAERSPAGERVTYFEMLTALAYWWFADYPVEVGIFEVGMGGSWDATNLVRGEVAVLTSIDVDHPELGNSPAETAVEKTGIIKPGAAVVSGAQSREVLDVIRAAVERQNATLLVEGDDFGVDERRLAVGGQVLTLRTPSRRHTEVFLPLHGRYQAENAAVALAAFHAFLGSLDKIEDDVVRAAFASVEVPGRLEVVSRSPTVVLDGAHNPAGARRAGEAIREAFAFRDLVLVAACLGDKNVVGIVRAFRDLASHVVVTRAPSSRAATLDGMEAAARSVWAGTSVAVERTSTIAEALDKATGVTGPSDGVLVTGSLYTVGAARDLYAPLDEP